MGQHLSAQSALMNALANLQRAETHRVRQIREDMWTVSVTTLRNAFFDEDDSDVYKVWVSTIPHLLRVSLVRLFREGNDVGAAFVMRLLNEMISAGPYPSRLSGTLPITPCRAEHSGTDVQTFRYDAGVSRGRWYYEVSIQYSPHERQPSLFVGWATEEAYISIVDGKSARSPDAQMHVEKQGGSGQFFVGSVQDSLAFEGTNQVGWCHGTAVDSPFQLVHTGSPDQSAAAHRSFGFCQGDLVGVGIDLEYGFVTIYLNGSCVAVYPMEEGREASWKVRKFFTELTTGVSSVYGRLVESFANQNFFSPTTRTQTESNLRSGNLQARTEAGIASPTPSGPVHFLLVDESLHDLESSGFGSDVDDDEMTRQFSEVENSSGPARISLPKYSFMGQKAWFPCISLHGDAAVDVRFSECMFVPPGYSPLESPADTHIILKSPDGRAFLALPDKEDGPPLANNSNSTKDRRGSTGGHQPSVLDFDVNEILSVDRFEYSADSSSASPFSLDIEPSPFADKMPYWSGACIGVADALLTFFLRNSTVGIPTRFFCRTLQVLQTALKWEHNRETALAFVRPLPSAGQASGRTVTAPTSSFPTSASVEMGQSPSVERGTPSSTLESGSIISTVLLLIQRVFDADIVSSFDDEFCPELFSSLVDSTVEICLSMLAHRRRTRTLEYARFSPALQFGELTLHAEIDQILQVASNFWGFYPTHAEHMPWVPTEYHAIRDLKLRLLLDGVATELDRIYSSVGLPLCFVESFSFLFSTFFKYFQTAHDSVGATNVKMVACFVLRFSRFRFDPNVSRAQDEIPLKTVMQLLVRNGVTFSHKHSMLYLAPTLSVFHHICKSSPSSVVLGVFKTYAPVLSAILGTLIQPHPVPAPASECVYWLIRTFSVFVVPNVLESDELDDILPFIFRSGLLNTMLRAISSNTPHVNVDDVSVALHSFLLHPNVQRVFWTYGASFYQVVREKLCLHAFDVKTVDMKYAFFFDALSYGRFNPVPLDVAVELCSYSVAALNKFAGMDRLQFRGHWGNHLQVLGLLLKVSSVGYRSRNIHLSSLTSVDALAFPTSSDIAKVSEVMFQAAQAFWKSISNFKHDPFFAVRRDICVFFAANGDTVRLSCLLFGTRDITELPIAEDLVVEYHPMVYMDVLGELLSYPLGQRFLKQMIPLFMSDRIVRSVFESSIWRMQMVRHFVDAFSSLRLQHDQSVVTLLCDICLVSPSHGSRSVLSIVAERLATYVRHLASVLLQLRSCVSDYALAMIDVSNSYTLFSHMCAQLIEHMLMAPVSGAQLHRMHRIVSDHCILEPLLQIKRVQLFVLDGRLDWLFALEPLYSLPSSPAPAPAPAPASNSQSLQATSTIDDVRAAATRVLGPTVSTEMNVDDDDILWDELFEIFVSRNWEDHFSSESIRRMVQQSWDAGAAHPSLRRENLRGLLRMWRRQRGFGTGMYEEASGKLEALLHVQYLLSFDVEVHGV
eukprot:ANDGO_00650.mRNA.1 hypothetical protein